MQRKRKTGKRIQHGVHPQNRRRVNSEREGTERQYFVLANRRPGLPFSDAVQIGETLYLAGRIGFDPATGKPAEKAEDEARFVLEQIRGVLGEAGMSMSDLVYVQVFCPDVTLFETFNAVYRTFFSGDLPARAFLGSGPLLFGARFEVQGIAVKKSAKKPKNKQKR